MGTARLLIHLILATIWCGSLYYDIHHMPRLGNEFWAAKLVMLTNINFVLFVAYSILSLVGTISNIRKINQITDFCFYTSIFPIGVTTCLLFWGLFAISPELVMPEWIRKLIPEWLNHVTHTLPVVHLLLDASLVHHEAPSKKVMLIMSASLVSVYFGILFYVRYVDGYWLYPILSVLATEHFVMALVVCIGGYFLLSLLAMLLTRLIHGKNNSGKKLTNKKKHY